MSKGKNGDRVSISVRLTPELHTRLIEAADERMLSANFLAIKAIEEFLENLIPVEELRLTRPRAES